MRMGKSVDSPHPATPNTEHPHAYGEKKPPGSKPPPVIGTSPCVWGKARLHCSLRFDFRNIPMRTGKSENASASVAGVSEHPHAYGEKSQFFNVLMINFLKISELFTTN